MLNLGCIGTAGRASLRAALAIVFLVMSSLQPGLFSAAGATGFHADQVAMENVGDEPSGADRHVHGVEAPDGADDPGKKLADKSCEVHCAPGHAVPISYPEIERVVMRTFVPVMRDAAIPLGEYNTPVRPPRTLI